MENSYGITVTNRYCLFLDEDEDPLEVLKVQEQAKEVKKKTKLSEKENKSKPEIKQKQPPQTRKNAKEPVQNIKSTDQGKLKEDSKPKPASQRPPQDRVDQRNVKFNNESRDREERNNWRNQEKGEFNREVKDRDIPRPEGTEGRFRGRGGRGVFRGGRGGPAMRGSRGGMGYDNRGKREYDRQSGSDKTGVKPVDKREGGGAHNWGNHRDEIQEQLNSQVQDDSDWQAEDVPVDQAVVAKESDTVDEVEPAQPVEEEPRELTLDEYYAMRGTRQKPTYNIRKAGEGEDPSQWKKMYALTKKKEGEEEDDDDEEYDASEYPQRVGRQKHILDIDIHFADSRRGNRGRGRGGMRGGRGVRGTGPVGPARNGGMGRAGPLADRNQIRERYERTDNYANRTPRQQSAPNVDDAHDFPSLG